MSDDERPAMFDVVMTLGSPLLKARYELRANVDALPETLARTLFADLRGCIGTSGIGPDNLTLLGVALEERT